MSEESYNAKMLRLASNGEANELKDHLELDTEEKDMNYVDPQTKYTVLTNAIQARNNDCIRILLQNGADPNFVMRVNDDSQYTALIIAFFLNDDANDDEPLKLLLDGGADPNIECLMDGDYTTLLTACIESLNFKFIHTLVKGGADVKKELFNDKALLMYCYITEAGEEPEKSAEMMQILISYGAPIEHKKLLAYAANFENVPCMQVLLDAGYPINKQMDHGTTALNLASEFGKESAVKFLLSKGADPNIMDMDGDSCVNTAALSDGVRIAERVVEIGVRIRGRAHGGRARRRARFDDDFVLRADVDGEGFEGGGRFRNRRWILAKRGGVGVLESRESGIV